MKKWTKWDMIIVISYIIGIGSFVTAGFMSGLQSGFLALGLAGVVNTIISAVAYENYRP